MLPQVISQQVFCKVVVPTFYLEKKCACEEYNPLAPPPPPSAPPSLNKVGVDDFKYESANF